MGMVMAAVCAGLTGAGCSVGGDDDTPIAQTPPPRTEQARSTTTTSPPARGPEFYAPDSPWNTPIPRDAPLDPKSDEFARELTRQVTEHEATIAIRAYTVAIYRVPENQPTVRVELANPRPAPALQRAFERVPLPPDAEPAAGTDGELLVYQPSTDTIWEFWRFRRRDGKAYAGWGGRMAEVSKSPGYYRRKTSPLVEKPIWGFTATNIGGAAGIMTRDEIVRGRIDHVLAMTIPDARKDVCTWPANSTDGQVDSPDAIPEGTRFRLDPDLDVEALDVPPFTKVMARAAQRYGVVINNRGGAVHFYAEDPSQYGGEPYAPAMAGYRPGEVAEAFPFDRLQTLRGDARPC